MSKYERTRNLRYKRPALASLGYTAISDELYEIMDACAEVQWFVENDGDTLLAALDGDDEEEFEFKMAFAELSGKAEQLSNALHEWRIGDHFDDCTVGLIGNRYRTVGYDSMEEDYFNLTSFEQELAHTNSGKKLMRMTKPEIISNVGQCLGIIISFLDLRQQYDYLKSTFDILRDENTSLLKIIKDIDETYEAANEVKFDWMKDECKRFDYLIRDLPKRIWLE